MLTKKNATIALSFVLFVYLLSNTRTFVNEKDGRPDRMENDLRALVHEVAETPVAFDGHRIGYTVTIGMKLSDDGEDIQKAINAADALLYEGKQSGKNRLITGNTPA